MCVCVCVSAHWCARSNVLAWRPKISRVQTRLRIFFFNPENNTFLSKI